MVFLKLQAHNANWMSAFGPTATTLERPKSQPQPTKTETSRKRRFALVSC